MGNLYLLWFTSKEEQCTFCHKNSVLSVADFHHGKTKFPLFTQMRLHMCYLPLSRIPPSNTFNSISYLNAYQFHLLTFPQEFIRHKLEEEQRQLEILQQQLLQEQALLMVTHLHNAFIISCFDCRCVHVLLLVIKPHQWRKNSVLSQLCDCVSVFVKTNTAVLHVCFCLGWMLLGTKKAAETNACTIRFLHLDLYLYQNKAYLGSRCAPWCWSALSLLSVGASPTILHFLKKHGLT